MPEPSPHKSMSDPNVRLDELFGSINIESKSSTKRNDLTDSSSPNRYKALRKFKSNKTKLHYLLKNLRKHWPPNAKDTVSDSNEDKGLIKCFKICIAGKTYNSQKHGQVDVVKMLQQKFLENQTLTSEALHTLRKEGGMSSFCIKEWYSWKRDQLRSASRQPFEVLRVLFKNNPYPTNEQFDRLKSCLPNLKRAEVEAWFRMKRAKSHILRPDAGDREEMVLWRMFRLRYPEAIADEDVKLVSYLLGMTYDDVRKVFTCWRKMSCGIDPDDDDDIFRDHENLHSAISSKESQEKDTVTGRQRSISQCSESSHGSLVIDEGADELDDSIGKNTTTANTPAVDAGQRITTTNAEIVAVETLTSSQTSVEVASLPLPIFTTSARSAIFTTASSSVFTTAGATTSSTSPRITVPDISDHRWVCTALKKLRRKQRKRGIPGKRKFYYAVVDDQQKKRLKRKRRRKGGKETRLCLPSADDLGDMPPALLNFDNFDDEHLAIRNNDVVYIGTYKKLAPGEKRPVDDLYIPATQAERLMCVGEIYDDDDETRSHDQQDLTPSSCRMAEALFSIMQASKPRRKKLKQTRLFTESETKRFRNAETKKRKTKEKAPKPVDRFPATTDHRSDTKLADHFPAAKSVDQHSIVSMQPSTSENPPIQSPLPVVVDDDDDTEIIETTRTKPKKRTLNQSLFVSSDDIDIIETTRTKQKKRMLDQALFSSSQSSYATPSPVLSCADERPIFQSWANYCDFLSTSCDVTTTTSSGSSSQLTTANTNPSTCSLMPASHVRAANTSVSTTQPPVNRIRMRNRRRKQRRGRVHDVMVTSRSFVKERTPVPLPSISSFLPRTPNHTMGSSANLDYGFVELPIKIEEVLPSSTRGDDVTDVKDEDENVDHVGVNDVDEDDVIEEDVEMVDDVDDDDDDDRLWIDDA